MRSKTGRSVCTFFMDEPYSRNHVECGNFAFICNPAMLEIV